jgi:hypothetical protein
MKKPLSLPRSIVAALFLPLVPAAVAQISQTTAWIGSGGTETSIGMETYGNWTSTANWSNSIGINTGLQVLIDEVPPNGGHVLMNSNADGIGTNELWIGTFTTRPKIGELVLSGGTLQHTDGSVTHKTTRVGDEGFGFLTQTGGTLYMNSGEMRIGNNANHGGRGLYDISGGKLSTNGGLRPGGNIMINRNRLHSAANNGGELRISGTANIDLGIADTNGAALGFGTGDGSPDSSVLSIIGADATINIDSIQMVNAGFTAAAPEPYLDTNRIRFTFDGVGVSTINLTGTFAFDPGTGEVEVSAVLAQGKLEVVYTGSAAPVVGATFDLMVGDYILQDASFALDPSAAANWSVAIVGTQTPGDASDDVLRLTFLGGQLPAVTTTRLVGYWPFDAEASPQPDGSDFGNDATPNAGVTWLMDNDRGSGVMEFDGNDSFLEAADSESLSLTGDLTIAAWVKPTDYAGFRGIVGKAESYDLYLAANNGWPTFFAGSPGEWVGTSSTSAIPAGEWHHFAVTIEDGRVALYVDGAPDGRAINPRAPLDSTAPLRIGNRGDLVTDFLGRMDDVAIFDGALPQAQIAEIMAGDFGRFGVGADFCITAFDLLGGEVTLTWKSRPGQTYRVKYSRDMLDWVPDLADGIPPDPGDTTTRTIDLSEFELEQEEKLFIRVEVE